MVETLPCCGPKGHCIGDCEVKTPSGLGKGRQIKFALASSANSDKQVLTVLSSGKETRATWKYCNKAVDGANNETKIIYSQPSC